MTSMHEIPLLKQLIEFDLVTKACEQEGYSLRDNGLILREEFSNISLFPMPTNVSTFAGTGGDGVEFSLLHIGGKPAEESPVIMTVPHAGANQNVVVGESLWDFLCLGSVTGFFYLEQLVYRYSYSEAIVFLFNWDEFLRNVYSRVTPSEYWLALLEIEQRFLQCFSREFGLSIWTAPEKKLNKLQEMHLHKLIIPENPW